jgi:hypothetical protein
MGVATCFTDSMATIVGIWPLRRRRLVGMNEDKPKTGTTTPSPNETPQQKAERERREKEQKEKQGRDPTRQQRGSDR